MHIAYILDKCKLRECASFVVYTIFISSYYKVMYAMDKKRAKHSIQTATK